MFTFSILRNSLLAGVNSTRIVSTRSLQLFRKPKSTDKSKDEDDFDEELEKSEPEKFSLDTDESIDPVEESNRIAMIRNKSRLRDAHRNILHNELPYNQAESWIHNTLKYKRMMYGRYGAASGLNPRICFDTPTEKADKQEFEQVSHPLTLRELMKENERQKAAKKEAEQKREASIIENIVKLKKWESDLREKIEKKESEARIAKQQKDRLIEEVRRHFGFSVHPKDERFQELLAKKEKEQKKALKEERKKVRESAMLAKIASKDKSIDTETKKEE